MPGEAGRLGAPPGHGLIQPVHIGVPRVRASPVLGTGGRALRKRLEEEAVAGGKDLPRNLYLVLPACGAVGGSIVDPARV